MTKKTKGEKANCETAKDYFASLAAYCEKITREGEEYLKNKEFIPNDTCIQRIWEAAQRIFIESGENWEAVPEWVADTMDGWMPYASVPRNGSLLFSLTYSSVAHDALLRNLLEVAEGRETEFLDLNFCMPKDQK